MTTRRAERQVYEDRNAVLDESEELGTPFRIKLPDCPHCGGIGAVRFTRDQSNAAAMYRVVRICGGTVHVCKPVDTTNLREQIASLDETQRREILALLEDHRSIKRKRRPRR